MIIGRKDDCDLCVPEAAVSGHHCELQFDGTFWWVRDLGSRNGTQINGDDITFRALRNGDELTIGNQQQFRISYSLPSTASFPEPLPQTAGNLRWLAIVCGITLLATLALAAGWWTLLSPR